MKIDTTQTPNIPYFDWTIESHDISLDQIDPTKIGEVIGSGGRTINKIIAETGAAIDIDDQGIVTVSGKDVQACQTAAKIIEGIVKEAEVGEIYEGAVKRILPFGAMVEILPGKEGLVHISQIANYRVAKVEDELKIGQKVKVRVAEIDDQVRQIILSAAREVLGRSISLSEHEQLVREALDKAKKDKVFA